MENFIRSPDPLKDNKLKTWIIWKEEFLIFMNLLGHMERSQSYKACVFKNLIGSVGIETINKLSFDRIEDKENLDILLQKLDNYYVPQQTEAQKRYKFFTTNMRSDETIENYIQKLQEKAKDCNFGVLIDSFIKDAVILNTTDKILRQKYLQEENLFYDKIIAIYKNHQIQERETKTKNSNVKSKNPKEDHKKKVLSTDLHSKEVPKECNSASGAGMHGYCWRCHFKHPLKQCPAWNYKCTKCNTLHHFEKCCKGPSQDVGNLSMNNLNLSYKNVSDKKMLYSVHKNL